MTLYQAAGRGELAYTAEWFLTDFRTEPSWVDSTNPRDNSLLGHHHRHRSSAKLFLLVLCMLERG